MIRIIIMMIIIIDCQKKTPIIIPKLVPFKKGLQWIRAVIHILLVKDQSNKSSTNENVSFCYTCDASSG